MEEEENQKLMINEINKITSKIPLVGEFSEDKVISINENTFNDPSSPTIHPGVEKTILECETDLISFLSKTKGFFKLTTTHIYFKEDLSAPQKFSTFQSSSSENNNHHEQKEENKITDRKAKEKKWKLEEIREVHLRRHLLRRSALEIFLTDKTNYLFNFSIKDRNKIFQKIVSLKPPNLIPTENGSPEEILRNSEYTQLWIEHKISNFDYLMYLNTIAGRTYNDLAQYPGIYFIYNSYFT